MGDTSRLRNIAGMQLALDNHMLTHTYAHTRVSMLQQDAVNSHHYLSRAGTSNSFSLTFCCIISKTSLGRREMRWPSLSASGGSSLSQSCRGKEGSEGGRVGRDGVKEEGREREGRGREEREGGGRGRGREGGGWRWRKGDGGRALLWERQ